MHAIWLKVVGERREKDTLFMALPGKRSIYSKVRAGFKNVPVFAIVGFGLNQGLARTAIQAQIRGTLRRAIAWI